jgi:hypothetical protein
MSDSLPGKPSQAEGDVGDDELSQGEESGRLDEFADDESGELDAAPDDRP